ncbi:PQQ-binding-like beta-propeller repeat protein [Paenibacillus sp. JTLBN-2024]
MLCGTVSLPAAIHADAPAVSAGFSGGQAIKAPVQKPLWTAAVDPGSKAAVTDDGTVLAFSGKKLIALNLATGKKAFAYGSNLKPSVQYLKGTAYGVGEDGHVYALHAKTGKELWKTAAGLSDADEPIVIGDTVYVTKKQTLIALDAATGKPRWKAVEDLRRKRQAICPWKRKASFLCPIAFPEHIPIRSLKPSTKKRAKPYGRPRSRQNPLPSGTGWCIPEGSVFI